MSDENEEIKPKAAKVVTVRKAAPKLKKKAHDAEATEASLKNKKKPVHEYSYGTGRRKTSIARVYLRKGSGKIFVNSKPVEEYFCNRAILLNAVLSPLKETTLTSAFDINAEVSGGGVCAQADAVRHGIARALVDYDAHMRSVLRPLDLLKRDPRMKERKKYGLKRARRAFQYTKR